MALKGKSEANNKKKFNYEVEVSKVRRISDKTVAFDALVNGVNIHSMMYIDYVNKEGKEGSMISFPSQKGQDDKYYNHVWFPINAEVKASIVEQLEKLL